MLKQKQEGENLIASPYSAWLPLAALVNGCSGATQEQLLKVIGEAGIDVETLNQTVKAVNAGLSQEERRKSYEEYGETFESPLKIANALFVQKDAAVNQTFEQLFRTITMENSFLLTFRIPLQQMPSTAGLQRRPMERL